MSCNSCGVKFNFFHGENGCSKCGLSFCSKCLKQKVKLSGENKEVPVCRRCYNMIASNQSFDRDLTPPDAYVKYMQSPVQPPPSYYSNAFVLRRLEALENPAAPPITVYKTSPKIQSLRSGLSPADQVLVDRLEKLKEDKHRHAPPSEDEIRKRLATLKDETLSEASNSSSSYVLAADKRSDQEKVDFLLEQFKSETDIGDDHEMDEKEDSLDSEEEMDKITQKVMAEVKLEEKCGEHSVDAPEELPWCVLCNKDAKFRCVTCGDLYCAECNIEVHRNWDKDHTIIPYKK